MKRYLPAKIPTLALLALVALCRAPLLLAAGAAVETAEECRDHLAVPPAEAAAVLPVPLRASTWNTMKFSRPGSPLVFTALASESDLLLLQESLRDAAPQSAHSSRLFAAGYLSGGQQSGVETRSHVSADVHCSLSFTEPWLRTPKAVAVSRYALASGEALLVVNLHGINFTLGIEDYARQVEAVGKLLATHDGPALVGGDFNNWSDARHAALTGILGDEGLEPVTVTPDLRSLHLGVPIDGFYVRGLRAATATAYPTDASDHNPVTAILLPLTPEAPVTADTGVPAIGSVGAPN